MKRRKCKRSRSKLVHSGHDWKISGAHYVTGGGRIAAAEETLWCPGFRKESDIDTPAVVPDPRSC